MRILKYLKLFGKINRYMISSIIDSGVPPIEVFKFLSAKSSFTILNSEY